MSSMSFLWHLILLLNIISSFLLFLCSDHVFYNKERREALITLFLLAKPEVPLVINIFYFRKLDVRCLNVESEETTAKELQTEFDAQTRHAR